MSNEASYNIQSYIANLPLPDCALHFNGEYVERTVLGYRTNAVSGREPITINITEVESEATDGASFSRKKIPARELSISFTLGHRNKNGVLKLMDQLKYLLYKKDDAIVRFNDESDVFYKGTVSKITGSEVDNSGGYGYIITGDITIRCSDPFKYSVKTYTVTQQSDKTIAVTYNGTYKAYPTITATMSSKENGYVAYVNDDSKILQFGNPEEADGETTYDGTEITCTLDDLFNTTDDHSSEIAHPTYGTAGYLGKIWYNANKHGTNPNRNFLALQGVGGNSKEWNGGMKTFTLSSDSKNFYANAHPLIWASTMGQTGELTISFLTSSNQFICGMNIVKNDKSGNTAKFETMVYKNASTGTVVRDDYNYKRIYVREFQSNHLYPDNVLYWDWGAIDVKKEGGTLTFSVDGEYQSFWIPEIADMACRKIQIAINYAQNRTTPGETALYWLGLSHFEFFKMDAAVWKNIENKFAQWSTLKIDCSTGDIWYNGISKPGLGALGNDWEDFALQPGETNQIQCLYSSWSNAPTCTLTYREVFL